MEFPFPDDSLDVFGVKCVCGLAQPEGADANPNDDWVLCERCRTWQHQVCVGIIPPLTDIGRYHCPPCAKKPKNEWTTSDDKRLWEKFRRDAGRMYMGQVDMEGWYKNFALENKMTHSQSTLRSHFKTLVQKYLHHDEVKDVRMKIFCAIASSSRLSRKVIDDFQIHGEVVMTPSKKIVAFIETGKTVPLYAVPRWKLRMSRRLVPDVDLQINDLPPLPIIEAVLANANMVLEARRMSQDQDPALADLPDDTPTTSNAVVIPTSPVAVIQNAPNVVELVTIRVSNVGNLQRLDEPPSQQSTLASTSEAAIPVQHKLLPSNPELATSIVPNTGGRSERPVAKPVGILPPLLQPASQQPTTPLASMSEAVDTVQHNLLRLNPLPEPTGPVVEDMEALNREEEMNPINGNDHGQQEARIKVEGEEPVVKKAKLEKEEEASKPAAKMEPVFDFLLCFGSFINTLSVNNEDLDKFVTDMKKKIMKIGFDVMMEYSKIAESLDSVFASAVNNAKTMGSFEEEHQKEINVLPKPTEYLDLTTFLKHLENFVGNYDLMSKEFGKLRKRIQGAIKESEEENKKEGNGKFLKIKGIKKRVWSIYDRHGIIDDDEE